MGGFGGYNEKKNKKKKQGGSNQSNGSFSSAPVFVAPQVIKKERKEK